LRQFAIFAAIMIPFASSAQTGEPPSTETSPPGINVTDARPKPETTEWLGWLSSDCNTGIRRIGDEKTAPPRLALLQSDLRAALGDKFATSTLQVTKYTIFVNASQWMQRSNPGANSLVGAFLIAGNCKKEDVIGGWYSADEVTNDRAPVVIEIEGLLEGKSVSARLVYSTDVDIISGWGLFGNKEKAQAALREAMTQADAKLIAQIQKP